MKFMTTDQIRGSFLEFFRSKGHPVVASDSLTPENDPTLLFTGAGMNQFKEYFLGLKKDKKRAASSQKCLRTGDLENVGRTAYHHSFFEMLGNFSFGDYFKEEAIAWAWEYLTLELGIPQDRLRVSVHHSDSEARKIWIEKIGVREDWVYSLGDDSNFWPANAPQDGPNGPCGPCSEIYYDMDPGSGDESIESKRFAEIWNLVFTQFDRRDRGALVPLASKNIDTGMGLERLAAVIQGKRSNYEIDLFSPIREKILSELKVRESEDHRSSVNAIADHVRAVTVAVSDGIVPTNEGRGYVVRKLIRRALWHAWSLSPKKKLEKPFLYHVAPVVAEVMQKAYPEILESLQSVAGQLKTEEERFLETLGTGMKILEEKIRLLDAGKKRVLSGDVVFELYDTYGFPDELTRRIAEEQGIATDMEGFEKNMKLQRNRAKQASKISGAIFVASDLEKKLTTVSATKFVGYETLQTDAQVVFCEEKEGEIVVALDRTPFYAESGGQVGDRGFLEGDGVRVEIKDVQKNDKVFLHYGSLIQGSIKIGDPVRACVDSLNRAEIMRHHTATHLLHAAIRKMLGEQVRQMGSMVSGERLRFDYSYPKPLTKDQIRKLEADIQTEILACKGVGREEKPADQAKKEGAIAFFGEKYGERVRVVSVPGFSKEFCGGTHCENTGQIGAFMIVGDSSVASGVRRIEAVAGQAALAWAQKNREILDSVSHEFKVHPDQIIERIRKLKDNIKSYEKQLEKGSAAAADIPSLIRSAEPAGRYSLVLYRREGLGVSELRGLSDSLRKAAKNTVYFLGTWSGEKIQFVSGVSEDLKTAPVDIREWIGKLSGALGSSGGGRKDWVQGGGSQAEPLAGGWENFRVLAKKALEEMK